MKFPLLLLLLIGFYSVTFAQKEKKALGLGSPRWKMWIY